VDTAHLSRLRRAALEGREPDIEDALSLLGGGEEELLEAIAAAAAVRRRSFGNRVKLNSLISMKSGGCPEDCGYCSQRRGSGAEVLGYSWLDAEEAVRIAERAAARGAGRVCLVASGRAPTARDLVRAADSVTAIRARFPELEVCVSLGLIGSEQAEALHEAGATAYNHNLNTAEGRYGEICSTHTYADRQASARRAKRSGLSLCSGAIFGMGESDREVVDLALALRELGPDSVPVNFLVPFAGTPLEGAWDLTPQRCLRILALLRFCFPDTELRLGAGREVHLRTMQPLALHLANSIFLGDYLTSEGQAASADLEMIEDAGFVIEGAVESPRRERGDLVRPRRRGPGTTEPANL
jgi:biotin synthase